jgi:hypothetical protein
MWHIQYPRYDNSNLNVHETTFVRWLDRFGPLRILNKPESISESMVFIDVPFDTEPSIHSEAPSRIHPYQKHEKKRNSKVEEMWVQIMEFTQP